jgi:glycogen synthase kinase 3 beta
MSVSMGAEDWQTLTELTTSVMQKGSTQTSHLVGPSKWIYTPLIMLGRGSFGTVFSSMAADGQKVAVKKVMVEKGKMCTELEILKMLRSPFCLSLIDHYVQPASEDNMMYLFLVTEVMPESLGRLIRTSHQLGHRLPGLMIKLFLYQLFAGLAHIHSLGIAHRDIKTDNCLVDPVDGRLKIIDFGSAKVMEVGVHHASYIASRIYRAPELLLDSTLYTNKVDIWAAGCVAAEMVLEAIPMFQGSCNSDHLVQIMHVLGPPTAEDDASFDHPVPFPNVEQICTLEMALTLSTNKDLIQLLKSIFVYNPNKRPTAVECMKSPYFSDLFAKDAKLPNGNPLPKLPCPERLESM